MMRRLTVFTLLAAACASSPKGPGSEPEMLVYDHEVTQQGLESVELLFGWELQNPTSSKARVDAATWKLTIPGLAPIEGKTMLGVEAPAGGSVTGQIRVGAPLGVDRIDTTEEDPTVTYTFAATFDASAGDLDAFEAEWNGRLFVPQKPRISVEAQAGRYGGSGIELNFVVSVKNSNPFDVELGAFNYKLFVGGEEVSQDQLGEGQQIGPASELQYTVTRFLGKDDRYDLAKKLLKANNIPYRLEGKVAAGTVVVEKPIEGELSFAQ